MAKKKKSKSVQPKTAFQELLEEKIGDDDGNDDADETMEPESEWDDRTKALKATIEGGLEKALQLMDQDGSSFEEATLENSDDEDDVSSKESIEQEEDDLEQVDETKSVDQSEDKEESDDDEVEETNDKEESEDDRLDAEMEDEDNVDQEVESAEEAADPTVNQKNNLSSKALGVVTKELVARKKGWAWAETFDVIPSTPLPFDKETSVHDDLKREVAFHDLALEAVQQAKIKCEAASIPFSRPDDFFAEMVKTDEHMAKVKDRLIFDNKRIEAVAQRKANKEHMLRAKESKANKLAEKSKRKKDHFRAVEDWANEAAAGRGQRLADNDDVDAKFAKNRKRQNADKKYGYGGKQGRFKQNDPKSQNDFSDYFRSRNSGEQGAGKKRKNGSGANRKGKRARDASRSSR